MAIRMTAKELRVMSTARPLGPIMFQDLGLNMADGVEQLSPDKPFEVISKEVLPDFDADAIFVIISRGNEAAANFEELEKNAVWQNLKAVKQHQVYMLDGQKWLDYSSLGQDMALDNAVELFGP
ncbi:ABC transporter substrate-binding protein [Paenibacillus cisolokensis]